MAKSDARASETTLIARYFAPLSSPDMAFGLSDDAAFVSVPEGQQLVLTKDMLVADVHFLNDDDAALIARKALRVNLSDLAAKGAKPLGYLLGLGLPSDWTESWLARFCEGLGADQQEFDFVMLGGDTVKSPERLTLSITAFGTVDRSKTVLRRHARPGDDIYVTGTIGDSALGLKIRRGDADLPCLEHESARFLKDRFLLPRPRFEPGSLIRMFASASMDISDGLMGDAAKMARAASVRMQLDFDAIPLSPAARHWLELDEGIWPTIMGGGDDYELLFCAPSERRDEIVAAAEHMDVAVTRVGQVTEGEGAVLLSASGEPLLMEGEGAYEHF